MGKLSSQAMGRMEARSGSSCRLLRERRRASAARGVLRLDEIDLTHFLGDSQSPRLTVTVRATRNTRLAEAIPHARKILPAVSPQVCAFATFHRPHRKPQQADAPLEEDLVVGGLA